MNILKKIGVLLDVILGDTPYLNDLRDEIMWNSVIESDIIEEMIWTK